MSTIENIVDSTTDKFDQLIESIEKALALAEVGCCSKFSELNESAVFRYFSTLTDLLLNIQKLSTEIRQSNKM